MIHANRRCGFRVQDLHCKLCLQMFGFTFSERTDSCVQVEALAEDVLDGVTGGGMRKPRQLGSESRRPLRQHLSRDHLASTGGGDRKLLTRRHQQFTPTWKGHYNSGQ
jgi:hypothetical protein